MPLVFYSVPLLLVVATLGIVTRQASSSIIPTDMKRPSSSSASIFDDGNDSGNSNSVNLRKNDDSHLRLYYKSNLPGHTISHELEHRLIKNPNYQLNDRVNN